MYPSYDMILLRQQLLEDILADRRKTNDVADVLHVRRETISRWLAKYRFEGIDGISPKKPGPKKGSIIANKTSERVENLICNLAKNNPYKGPVGLRDILEEQNIQLQDLNKQVAKTQKRKALYDTSWYKEEPFALTPDVLEWRETSVKPVPGTFSKDYLQQTELLIRYVKQEMYKDKPLPAQYEEAIKEFEEQKPQIQPLIDNWNGDHPSGQKNWYVASQMLINLKITQLTRPTPVSTLQDITNLKSVGANMLESPYTWTSARSSSGNLVGVGDAVSGGAPVDGWLPNDQVGSLGASFSRSLQE